MPIEFAAIDFETTGLSPKSPHSHRVIEVGIVRFSLEDGISAEYETVINPLRDVGPFEIHRISAGEATGAPTFTEVANDIAKLLNGAVLIAHNKNFDLQFLRSELERAKIKHAELDALCTMELVGMVKPRGPRRLTDCCEVLGVDVLDAHRALNDAKMAANIAISVLKSTGFPALTDPIDIQGPFQISSPPKKRGEFIPKTVTQGTYLRNVMDRLQHQELPVSRIGLAVSEYLNLLEHVLEDRRIDRTEADQLVELADRLAIPKSQLGAIHATYFSTICDHALVDGTISDDEEKDIQSVAELLDIGDWREIVNISSPRIPNSQTSSRIPKGTTVCFTGSMKYPRQKCIDIATAAGLINMDRVTKSLDILVVADPDSQSSKATAAKKYGLRILAATAFFDLIGDPIIPDPEDSEDEEDSISLETDDNPREFLISINGRDLDLYRASSAIDADLIMAKEEVTELLKGLTAQEFEVLELQNRLRELRKNLPKQSILSQIELDIAPKIRDVLTDVYTHLQYLREQSHVVTQQVQYDANSYSDWVVETLAMLSLIPALPNFQDVPAEIWPKYLLEQIDNSAKNLSSNVKQLTTSKFLIAESATDFSDPLTVSRLQNCSIVITGTFNDFSREEGIGAILRRGGKSPTSVSGKTYALVAGEMAGGTKLQQAQNKGIQILSAEGFRTLLNEGPGKSLPEIKGIKSNNPKDALDKAYETLTCVICSTVFTRLRVKGRKPHSCPECNF
jgi:DNA polymerase III subunit epsilon